MAQITHEDFGRLRGARWTGPRAHKCRRCGAEVGSPCDGPGKSDASWFHDTRWDDATLTRQANDGQATSASEPAPQRD